jgi:ribosomal protein S6
MKNRYEGLLILNVKGAEDSAKEIIDRLEKDFTKEGARVEQVQKMDRRHFSYVAGPLDSGYYVNFIFEAAPETVTKLRAKLKLDEEVYRQSYLRLPAKKAA